MSPGASRRRPLSSSQLRSAAVFTLVLGSGSVYAQAQEFMGVGRAYGATRGAATIRGSSTSSTQSLASEPNFAAVHSTHIPRACGRCVRVHWWSNANETLRVVGECDDCGVADLSFSADVYTRIKETRDAGWDPEEPMAITWHFIDCPTRQLQQETFASPVNSSTSSHIVPSPSPPNANTDANSTTTSSPSPSPRATEIATPAPSTTNTTTITTAEPTVGSTNTSTLSQQGNTSNSNNSNSTRHAGCSPLETGNGANRSAAADYKLSCDESKANTTTTAIDETRSTPASENSPAPITGSSTSTAPSTTPVENEPDLASKSPTTLLVVVAKSVKFVANAKVFSSVPAGKSGKPPATPEAVSVKSTQFSSISTTKDAATPTVAPASSLVSASAPATTPRKKAPLPDKNDEEEYAPATGSSSTSDSKKKKKKNKVGGDGSETNSNSRMYDDSSLPGHRHETLIKNPFFLSSMLLAVVGVVGAVVAYRAKEQRQRRHVHQNVVWRQYSQRVQSASSRTPLGTPSPGGAATMGDAYIASNTTRHGASSFPAVTTAAASSPTLFNPATTRAQLGML